MKHVLVLLSVLCLSVGVAWAEEAAAEADSPAAIESTSPAADTSDDADGGCRLPDLTGLSDEEAEAALDAAGFEVPAKVEAQTPMCPTITSCSSFTNCNVSVPCAVADIGPCCQVGGQTRCCVIGTIKVKTCPCECPGPLCAIECAFTKNVRTSCS